MEEDVRWKQRLETFRARLAKLEEACALGNLQDLNELAQEGAVHRFETLTDVSWKLMKDFLESEGVLLEKKVPKAVIRYAYQNRIIGDGDTWIELIDERNAMSHEYDEERFLELLKKIEDVFLPLFQELPMTLENWS